MKKIIALLLIFAMCLSFAACDGKKKGSNDDDVKTTDVNKDICASCFEKMTGEWFLLTYNEETETDELKTVKVTENGKLIVNGNEYTIKFINCEQNSHDNAVAYDADGNQSYALNYRLDDNGVHTLDFWATNNYDPQPYRSMKQFTVVELTDGNWKNYFSTNFNETFEEDLFLGIDKDTKGDIDTGWIRRRYMLKNTEKYAYGTTLTMEYSFEFGDVYCEFDVASETITKYDFTKYNDKIDSTIGIMRFASWDIPENFYLDIGSVYLNKQELLAGNGQEIGYVSPIEILSMEGWLVIRNDV